MISSSPIRRILVAFDASPESLVAAEAAAQLAHILHAELEGLFVEDIQILHLSSSPLAREVDFLTASPRALDRISGEHQLRAHAERSRRGFERIVAPFRILSRFRVRRGKVPEEVLAAASEADIVALGAFGWSLRQRRRLGATARAVLGASGRLLVLQRPLELTAPIALLHDPGTPEDAVALALTVSLAAAARIPLRILAATPPHEDARNALLGRLSAGGVDAELEWLGTSDPETLAHRIGRRSALVVVPWRGTEADEDRLQVLSRLLECPFLVVGGPG